ncbi:oligosaccharide flippase family protein [Patescibacteria group bacterium]|nr:oligosaccharide flippase family protein [Patescibacteria group bacterium]
MGEKILKILRHNFVKTGSVVLIGSFLVNFLNYLFNLTMGRMLSPEKFGEVAALMGLAVIVSVPSAAIMKIMARYVAAFHAKNEKEKIKQLLSAIMRWSIFLSLILVLAFLVLIPLISSYLHIERLPFYIFVLILPLALVFSVSQGMLQGLLKFVPFSIANIIASAAKLLLAIIFVLSGYSVSGVVAAFVIAGFLSTAYGLRKIKPFLEMKKLLGEKVENLLKRKEISNYAGIMFWTTLIMIFFTNIDVILAKHYLVPDLAGKYAALSVLGKIVIFCSGSFFTIIFPKVSTAQVNGDGREKLFLKISLLLVGSTSGAVAIVFSLFPELIVKIFFGSAYLAIAPYLGLFSLAMLFGVLGQAFLNYYMALNTKSYLYPMTFVTIFQIVAIALFHSDIQQIVNCILLSNFIYFVIMAMTYLMKKTTVLQKEKLSI